MVSKTKSANHKSTADYHAPDRVADNPLTPGTMSNSVPKQSCGAPAYRTAT